MTSQILPNFNQQIMIVPVPTSDNSKADHILEYWEIVKMGILE